MIFFSMITAVVGFSERGNDVVVDAATACANTNSFCATVCSCEGDILAPDDDSTWIQLFDFADNFLPFD